MSKLEGINPELAGKICMVMDALSRLGFPMMVTDGKRSMEQQAILYAKGRTIPGIIVTYCDGVTTTSKHQSGKAVDCCFMVDGKPSWDSRLPWKAYGACAEALGLVWGGSWASLHDLPHIELP